MSEEYRQFIAKYQCKRGSFHNNYYFAITNLNMHNHHNNEEFPLPMFLLEEELEREDDNVDLIPEKATVSLTLKHFIIYLLRKCNIRMQVTESNYEEALRDFFDQEHSLPDDVSNPLTPSTSFHCLPTACKIYIIYLLRCRSNIPSLSLIANTTDTESNIFYVLPDGRVFVFLKNIHNNAPSDYEGMPWFSLFNHSMSYKFNLLSETSADWRTVEVPMARFGQPNVAMQLSNTVQAALNNNNRSGRQEMRKKFFAFLNMLVNGDEGEETRNPIETPILVNSTAEALSTMSLADPSEVKCPLFPQCKRRDCKDVHPEEDCVLFINNVPCAGQSCLFMHGQCPVDGECNNEGCIYEHHKSLPVMMRNGPMPAMENRTHQAERRIIRCRFFPRCRYTAERCRFVHPENQCRDFFETICVHGRNCIYLHGNCPNDGDCDDQYCPHEHIKSLPIALRGNHMRGRPAQSFSRHRAASVRSLNYDSQRYHNAESEGEMDSRSVTSIGHREECQPRGRSSTRHRSSSRAASGRSRHSHYGSRRSHINNSDSEEEEEVVRRIEQRCHFFPNCTRGFCQYIHPDEDCKAFPRCPYGLACLFLHAPCPNDGVCVKLSCTYEHYMRRNIGNFWCKKGSSCRTNNCKYLHPKKCKEPCPSPNDCWKYHPPGAASAFRARSKSVSRRN